MGHGRLPLPRCFAGDQHGNGRFRERLSRSDEISSSSACSTVYNENKIISGLWTSR